ncbi:hypothetical protein M405DRAFT_817505 [Rhizopogon salebrosus TDB-379]|nr:hypothetical protein M405DRAFT_817505 [Rhizopogon salebrosus TDB-379]
MEVNHSSGQGTFEHNIDGYDAGYYGSTYSLVLAVDAALGRLYKDKILLVGGSREETESL